jgi:hypothetical protein
MLNVTFVIYISLRPYRPLFAAVLVVTMDGQWRGSFVHTEYFWKEGITHSVYVANMAR